MSLLLFLLVELLLFLLLLRGILANLLLVTLVFALSSLSFVFLNICDFNMIYSYDNSNSFIFSFILFSMSLFSILKSWSADNENILWVFCSSIRFIITLLILFSITIVFVTSWVNILFYCSNFYTCFCNFCVSLSPICFSGDLDPRLFGETWAGEY